MNKIYAYVMAGLVVCGVSGAGVYYYYRHMPVQQTVPLIDFDFDRDFSDIHTIFEKNWYWLMPYPPEAYDPDYLLHVFKYRAPQANPLKKGTLTIKVVRHEGHVIAFTAYHMKSKTSGFLLFVAVDNNFRGKKYGETLVKHALKAMTDRGAKQIQLNTRIDNIPAQKLYKKMGFAEMVRDTIYVYYTYKVV